ncbi:hypothetical protein OsJ_01084 [Oryza sativa Japonica Group]|uniref:Uncharacterized protein n=1 Tax=Oryza sativa subsp. japonica TaxID=39947 RepID=B9EUN1_ORYSJ|nr:hypothetical protein OsJ_01084 [Oryza sativa Japonica Group]
MANPVVPCPSAAAYGPGGCDGVGCSSSHNVWAHRVRHNGGVYRLCSSCVLLGHRDAFCSVCLDVFPGDAPFQDDFYNPIVSCSCCGVEPVAAAHLACLTDPSYFVCPACAAAAEGQDLHLRPLERCPARAGGARAPRRGAARARVRRPVPRRRRASSRAPDPEAAAARKRARDMVDVACRVLEAEARDAKEQAAAPPSTVLTKKTTPKNSAANRSSDKPLKINSIQKPALAFAAAAAAAAAAASSTPLSTPSPAGERKPMKQGRASANRGAKDDQRTLFGAFQP